MIRLVVTLLIVIFSFNASAMTYALGEVTEVKEKTDQEKLDENLKNQKATAEKIATLQKQIAATIDEVQRIETLIEEKKAEISELQKQMDQYNKEVAALQAILSMQGEAYSGQTEIFKTRVRGIYELGVLGFWDMLFTSKSIPELLAKYDLITKLVEYDRNILASISNKKVDVEQTKRDLESKNNALKLIKEHKEQITVNLEQDKADQDKVLDTLHNNKDAVDLMLKTMQEEETKIKEAILAASNGIYGGGKLDWPVPKHFSITSPFGTRIDPITGTEVHHNAIDIGAPEGAEIVAIEKGTVIVTMNDSEYNGGCGNYVLLDHGIGPDGKKYASRYLHMQKTNVKLGDVVEKGQVIGYIGSTGRVTGPHLDFSISVGGEYKNPIEFYTDVNSTINK